LAGSGDSVRAGVSATICSTAGLRVDVDSRGELRVVACVGTGGGVPVLAEIESGGSVRVGVTAAVCSKAGPRVDVEPRDELEVGPCTGIRCVLRVSAGPESSGSVLIDFREGVKASTGLLVDPGDKLEAVACAGTSVGVPDLAETEFGGGDLVGITAAGVPSAGLRLGPTTGIEPGITVGAGPRALVGDAV
jgi:hypothetical protein